MSRPWAIVAGGGTAGHVLPALAVGQELAARGVPKDRLLFVGSTRGIERTLVPAAGFPGLLLPGRGIQRRLTSQNVGAIAGLVAAGVRAFAVVATKRPAVVLSVGGYASVPVVVAAAALRVPIVVHEQNAKPGVANRLTAKVARAAAVSFANTALPRAVLTGNPVREEIGALTIGDRSAARAEARTTLGIANDRVMIVVFGGSLGARRINQAAESASALWRDRRDLAIYHVVGERDADRSLAEQPELGPDGLDRRVVRYEHRMPLVFAAADIAVCRAGATSIADLAAAGLPSVLIPLPIAAEDHQTANAKAVVADGAGLLIADNELDGSRLVAAIEGLLSGGALSAMASAALRRARPSAASDVADLLERHASRPRPGAAR